LGILPEHDAPKPGAVLPRNYHWLTAVSAAVTVAIGVTAFEAHEQILAHRHPPDEPTTTPVKQEPPAMTYEKARQFLATGALPAGEQAFEGLDEKADTPQPQKNWTTLHTALAELLDGHADRADAHLKALEDR